MRNELQHIEIIERYLLDQMEAQEKLNFEKELARDTKLQEAVRTQQQFQRAVKRAAIRKEIQAAANGGGFFLGNSIWWFGGVMGALIVVGSIFWVATSQGEEGFGEKVEGTEGLGLIEKGKEMEQPEIQVDSIFSTFYTEDEIALGTVGAEKVVMNAPIPVQDDPKSSEHRIDFEGLKTWVEPTVESFGIDSKVSQVLEGEFGTLITVPANAFEDESGKVVNAEVKVKLVEALALEQMILYNLTTSADGKALQTGGMIHLSFESAGKEVFVKADKPLYIQIPTQEVRPNMMAFEGEVSAGKVNWTNPKKLKQYLIPVPFEQLDFLPSGFERTLNNHLPVLELSTANKRQADSVYYSLHLSGENVSSGVEKIGQRELQKYVDSNGVTREYEIDVASSSSSSIIRCGVNPVSIQSIRSKKFDQTFIATRAFEKRIGILHTVDNGQKVLEVYLKNLDKDLSYSDSIAATLVSGSQKSYFQEFHREKLGNVKDAELYAGALKDYYQKVYNQNKKKQERLNQLLAEERSDELKKMQKAYVKAVSGRGSFFSKVASAINMNPISLIAQPQTSYYAFNWNKGGWINIDEYLHLLSKGAEYVSISVEGQRGTSEVYNYINTLKNITGLYVKEGVAQFAVPKKGSPGSNRMKETYCLGIAKDGDQYFWADQRYRPYGDAAGVSLAFAPATISEIKANISGYGLQNDVVNAIKKSEKEIEYRKQQQAQRQAGINKENAERKARMDQAKKEYDAAAEKWRKHQAMMLALARVSFPCLDEEVQSEEKVVVPIETPVEAGFEGWVE